MDPDAGLFRALVERCPMVSYACDEQNRIVYISPQIEAWTGLPASMWTDDPTHWHRMLHPDDRERVVSADFGGRALDIEYRMRGRDGTWLWVWEHEVKVEGQTGSQGICIDITALRETREALEAARSQLSAVVNAAPVILFATDADGTITLSEGQALRSLGLEPGEMVGQSIFSGPAEGNTLQAHARRALAGESFHTHGDVGDCTYDCTWHAQEDGSIIGIAIDVTARHRSEARLAHLAYHDPLTGLPNRSTLEEHLARDLARARREGDTVAALYIDLDHFKLVNDSLGHAAGDRVLAEVAERIRGDHPRRRPARPARRRRVHARLPRPERAAARRPSRRRCSTCSTRRSCVDGAEFQIGASIGIAVGPRDGADAAELIKHADAAMYRAKRSGRDAYALYCAGTEDARGQPHADRPAAARARRGRVRAALPARLRPRHGPGARRRGARALAGPRGRARPARRLHPPRRGDGADPAHRRLGARGRLPPGRRVGRGGARRRGSRSTPRRASCATPPTPSASPRALERHGLAPSSCSMEVRESPIDDVGRAPTR